VKSINFNTVTRVNRPDMRPRVLLIDAEQRRLDRWEGLLGNVALVGTMKDLTELHYTLTNEHVDVLVSEWNETLWNTLERTGWTTHYLHVGTNLPEQLVDAAGQPVSSISSDEELREKVLDIVHFRRPRSVRRRLENCSLTLDGGSERLTVVDLSSFGLAFEVDAGRDLERFLPGTLLQGAVVRKGEAVVIEGTSLRVRHLKAEQHSYRVGCEFPVVEAATEQPTLITDPVACAALLNQALMGPGVFLERHTGVAIAGHVRGKVDTHSRTALLDSSGASLGEGELLQGGFEVGGSLYRFVAPVVGTQPLRLHLPTHLEERHRRRATRQRVGTSEVRVTLHNELGTAPYSGPVLDLSANGLAIPIAHEQDLFPVGLLLRVELELGGGAARIVGNGRVRNVARQASGAATRCGVEFLALSDPDRLRLAEYVVRTRLPGVDNGGAVPFDQLWELFGGGRLLSVERQRDMNAYLPRVRHTFEALARAPSSLFRSIVVRADGKVAGHVSAVRVYRRTWWVQHLAAQGIGTTSYVLNMAAAEYFGQLSELEYFHIGFFADNKWPAQVFGGFGRRQRDAGASQIRGVYAITLPTQGPLGFEAPPNIEVDWATPNELAEIQAYFVRNESPLVLRANDLTLTAMDLGSVDESFRELGLSRTRRFLVARASGVMRAFASVELSPVALNVHEVFSAFQIRLLEGVGGAVAPLLRGALLSRLSQVFREAERPFARGFIRRTEINDYAAMGLPASGRIVLWTCHRTEFRRFTDHVERLFRGILARHERNQAAKRAREAAPS